MLGRVDGMRHGDDVAGGAGGRRERVMRWLVAATVAWLAVQLVLVAVSVPAGVPPDESTHLGIVELYRRQFPALSVADSPASYRLGLVSHTPNLYYVVMGAAAAALPADTDPTVPLRLLDAALALLTVLAGLALARRVSRDPTVWAALAGILGGVSMFVFLGASVSYDNLTNLLATLAVLEAVSLVREPGWRPLLRLGLWGALGCLTKVTFLPVAALLAVLVPAMAWRQLWTSVGEAWGALRALRPAALALAAAVSLAAATGVVLYGGNLVRFGRLVPGCTQVLTLDQCLENRIFARDWVFRQYLEGRMSYAQAWRETARIRNPGDRDHARRLLDNERMYRLARPELLPLWAYLREVWHRALEPTMFGVQAHVSLVRSPRSLAALDTFLFAAFVLWVRRFSLRGEERIWAGLAALVAGYYLILVGWFNYTHYLRTHAPLLGVQGRYLFPVLVPAALLVADSVLRPFRGRMRVAVACGVILLFLANGLPWVVRHAPPGLFAPGSPLARIAGAAR